jgi:(R,R)-butanediol dehydrogenase/meso-butanediol dehydrogenase/diacetyl reductase
MKAAQYFGQRDIRVIDVPEPVPEPNEVLLSIEWGGICGSDLHEYVMGKMQQME